MKVRSMEYVNTYGVRSTYSVASVQDTRSRAIPSIMATALYSMDGAELRRYMMPRSLQWFRLGLAPKELGLADSTGYMAHKQMTDGKR